MSQSPLWFVVFLLTKFIYNPVGFLFQHRDPGSTRMWNQKLSLPAQRPRSTRTWNQKFPLPAQRPRSARTWTQEFPHQHRGPGLPGRGLRSFLTSTEVWVCQDVESEVSSPAQRPRSARTWNQKCPHQHRGPGLPGRGLRSRQASPV